MIEGRMFDSVDADNGVERAAVVHVPELDAFNVIGRSAYILSHLGNVIRRHVNKFRVRIHEAADQPGTGNAVNLGMFARHPFVFGRPALAARRKIALLPATWEVVMSNASKGLIAGLVATLVLSVLIILNGTMGLMPQ